MLHDAYIFEYDIRYIITDATAVWPNLTRNEQPGVPKLMTTVTVQEEMPLPNVPP